MNSGGKRALAELFSCASACFSYPDAAFSKSLYESSFAKQLLGALEDARLSEVAFPDGIADDAGEFFADRLRGYAQSGEEETLHRVRRAYTDVFLGMPEPRVPMTESEFMAWQGGESALAFANPCALDVKRLYRQVHVTMAPGRNDPADTVYAELEFLSYLLARGGESNLLLFDVFSTDHFERWAQPFAEAVEDASTEGVLVVGARLLRLLASFDRASLHPSSRGA